MLLYACKSSGPSGLEYLSTEPYRWWKPIQTYHAPHFEMPAKLDNNDPALVISNQFWQRRLNKLAANARVPFTSGTINKTNNHSASISYVPCKELLHFFESAQIVELEVLPGQIVKETYLDMSKFKSLGRSVAKLRSSMEDAGVI